MDLQSLHERLHVVETELATATQKTNEIQQQLESERKTFATDKKTLEETIIDMTSSAANTQVDEAERASAIKLQEERIVVSNCNLRFCSSVQLHMQPGRGREISTRINLARRFYQGDRQSETTAIQSSKSYTREADSY